MIYGNREVCPDGPVKNITECKSEPVKITNMDLYNNAMFALYSFTFGQDVDRNVIINLENNSSLKILKIPNFLIK